MEKCLTAPPKHNFEKSKIHACVSVVLVSGTVIFIVQNVGGGTLKKHGPQRRGFRVTWGVCGKHVKQISPTDWET